MKLLVCGGRTYGQRVGESDTLDRALSAFASGHDVTLVVHGAARGADSLAGEWARLHGVDVVEYPAEWNKYGRSAGFKRNKQMLDAESPDWVIAFPGGTGTNMMVNLALQAGVPVWRVRFNKLVRITQEI